MLTFPTKNIDGREVSVIRRFVPFNDFIEIELNTTVESISPAFVLKTLSNEVFGTPDRWFEIADVNPPKNPSDWEAGDVVRVPNFARTRDEELKALKRKRIFSLES